MRLLQRQEGMALLLVLVIVALLSALLVEFSFSTLVDLRATETFRDRTRAFYLARGGIEAARMILVEDQNNYDHPAEFWGDDMAAIPAGEGDVSLKIRDLTGRFNLNTIADNRGNPLSGYHRFIALCEELQIEQTQAQDLADSLLHWFNADKTQVTPDDNYYAQLQPPYARKGAKLDTLEELALVRGFDTDIRMQLAAYVRVVGDEQININTASAEVLYAWQFSAAAGNVDIIFDQQDIDALMNYRQRSAYRQLADLALAEGIGQRWSAAWLANSVGVKGKVYELVSRGRINQGIRVAKAVVAKEGNQLLRLKVE